MIDVLVGDHYRRDGLRQYLDELEARRHSTWRETGVHQNTSSPGLDEYCVAFASTAEHVYDHGA